MTPQEEAATERKIEQMLKGHRQAPDGRDYRAFRYRFEPPATDPGFSKRYDETFPDAPGSVGWWAKR